MIDSIHGAISRSEKSNEVLQQLRYDIIVRKYLPGEKLTELAIGDRYAISRSPVRAILQQLEKEGLIAVLPNGCKEVTGFSRRDMQNLYSLRDYLEITAVQATASSPTKNYAPLIRLLSDIEGEKRDCDLASVIETDVDFHRAVIAMADNRYLLSAYDNIAPTLYTIFLISTRTYTEDFLRAFNDRHTALIKTLVDGDAETCVRVFREHHQNARHHSEVMMDAIENGSLL